MSWIAESSQLLPAREQMAFTLAFHIVFASMGVAFPLITVVANWWGLRKNDENALKLARRWSKVMAVLFAVGAVTGTVLSFEFGLLWPEFMKRFGDVFGLGFAIEGIFFFTEAIFIAIYIYGWKHLSPRAHLLSGIPIVIAGIGGAFSVVAVNSWMNQPQGFDLNAAGEAVNIDPVAALLNSATAYEVPHMLLAAYLVAGFVVASVYAFAILRGRNDRYHRLGFAIPFTIAVIAAPIQFGIGDTAARAIAVDQPSKFASMEYIEKTGPNQTEWVGGILHDGKVKLGIGLPDVDSILVGFSPDTVVTGLDQVPKNERPPSPTLLHLAFDTMVGIGSAYLLLGAFYAFYWWRRRNLPKSVWFWRAAVVAGPAAVLALWCGWIVTEVGRQPWIVYKVMRTEEAITGASGIWVTFSVAVVLYTALGAGTIYALRTMARRWREEPDEDQAVPYGPLPGAKMISRSAADERAGCGRGSPLGRSDPLRGTRRRRLRRRFLGSARRRGGARSAAARADGSCGEPGLGGQPRLADLPARVHLDGLPRCVRGDLLDALRPAGARRARDRPARRRLCLPPHHSRRAGPPRARGHLRDLVRLDPVLHGDRRRGDRERTGSGRRRR